MRQGGEVRHGNAAQASSRQRLPQADEGTRLGVKAFLMAVPPTLRALRYSQMDALLYLVGKAITGTVGGPQVQSQ